MTYYKPIELYQLFEQIVDSIRATGVVSSYSYLDGVYTLFSSNSLTDYEYITINDVDYIVYNAINSQFQIKAASGLDFTAATWSAKAPYFMHEKEAKAAEVLTEKTGKDNLKWQKYPLILLIHPYTTNHGNLTVTVSPTLYIITQTEQSYWSDDRYTNTIEPILFPIYEKLIDAICSNVYIKQSFPQNLQHTKTDLLFIDGNPFPDKMDGLRIELSDLEILAIINC